MGFQENGTRRACGRGSRSDGERRLRFGRERSREPFAYGSALFQQTISIQRFMEDMKMLVLSRKEGQRVIIGSEIEVTVLGIQGGRVKLGFSCPDHVSIRREELVQQVTPTDLSLPTTVAPVLAQPAIR